MRLTALTVVVAMPLMGMAGVASAKTAKATTAKCAKHAYAKKCLAAGGGATGGASPQITVTADPNPLVETGQSEVHTIIQVETLPSFAGDAVTISSQQLVSSCEPDSVFFDTVRTGEEVGGMDSITVILDDDGNATVGLQGYNCAPGSSVIEADLDVAPYLTALTTLIANPPVVTAPGLTGYPNNEVETGDTGNTAMAPAPNNASGDSDVYAVFYVEDSPVYAEQNVEISSGQLEARCGDDQWDWFPGNNGDPDFGDTPAATTTLDDDGNAVFVFKGISCAAGSSQVIADVLAGTHDTFTFEYTIDPPAPTI
jgi:hypothetical protein